MPTIIIQMYKGRTKQQKADLAKAITEDVVRIAKTTPEATQVIFHEVDKENWATAGILASDK
jgi:4-oxalocrotonate tautomerase